MQTRMTIKYISYGEIEDTTLFRILKYFTENWNKKDFYEYDDNLPKKVLNFDRGCEEIFARLMKCDSNTSPLFDENVRFQLAKDVAKKLSDIQYQKFLKIKNGKDIDNNEGKNNRR